MKVVRHVPGRTLVLEARADASTSSLDFAFRPFFVAIGAFIAFIVGLFLSAIVTVVVEVALDLRQDTVDLLRHGITVLPVLLVAGRLIPGWRVVRLVADRQRGRWQVEEMRLTLPFLAGARTREIPIDGIREIRFDAATLDALGDDLPASDVTGAMVTVRLSTARRPVRLLLESGATAAKATDLALLLAGAAGLPWMRQLKRKDLELALVFTRDPSGARAVPSLDGEGAEASAPGSVRQAPDIACPACRARLDAASVSKDMYLARCPSCSAVIDLTGHGDAGAIPARSLMRPPRGVAVEHARSGGCEVRIDWRRTRRGSGVFLVVTGGLAALALLLAGIVLGGRSEWASHGAVLAWIAIVLVAMAVAAACVYVIPARLLNATVIRVSGGRLTVSHAPLPWPGRRDLAVAEVAEVSSEECEPESGPSKYRLVVRTTSGRKIRLVSGLATGLSRHAAVRCVEHEIACALGVPVRGARRADGTGAAECPACGEDFPRTDVSAPLSAARCGRCGAVVNLAAGKAGGAAPVQRPRLSLPPRYRVERDGTGLTVRWASFSLARLGVLAFAIAWIGVAAWEVRSAMREPGTDVASKVGLGFLLATGVAFSYTALAGVVNETVLRAGRDLLTVRRGPLPLGSGRSIRIGAIAKLDCRSDEDGSSLFAMLGDDGEALVVGGLAEADEAQALAQLLEEEVGLQDRRVSEEASG